MSVLFSMEDIEARAEEDSYGYYSTCIEAKNEEIDFFEPQNDLMQFTGIRDKNGKEIYHKDLIKVDDEFKTDIHVVKWGSHCTGGSEYCGYWGWYIAPVNNDIDVTQENLGDSGEEYEVIGNIYENKDLLK